MEDSVLKIVYTFFVGVMLALFIGLGIDAVYSQPEYPDSSIYYGSSEPTVAEQQAMQDEQDAYQGSIETYNRTVSIIATAFAVAMLVLSLALEKKNKVLTNGVMLGGLFTLIYGVGRGFTSGDSKTTFITVAAGLVVVLFLGYRRFAHRGHAAGPPSTA